MKLLAFSFQFNHETKHRSKSFLHRNNELIKLFKIALDWMPSDEHNLVITVDKTLTAEHMKGFNSPTIYEMAIVNVG